MEAPLFNDIMTAIDMGKVDDARNVAKSLLHIWISEGSPRQTGEKMQHRGTNEILSAVE